jgi:hypothetical protein
MWNPCGLQAQITQYNHWFGTSKFLADSMQNLYGICEFHAESAQNTWGRVKTSNTQSPNCKPIWSKSGLRGL